MASIVHEARCRNEHGKCMAHPASKEWTIASAPDTVLAKFGLDPDGIQSDLFREAGVREELRTEGRRDELELDHALQAERVGRDAYTARPGERRREQESADSGCPVFSKKGLAGKRISGLELVMSELPAAGFVLTRYSILVRADKSDILTLEFSKQGTKAPAVGFPWPTLLAFISGQAFNQLYVWANERDLRRAVPEFYPKGRVIHTVQFFAPLEPDAQGRNKPPQTTLRYANGLWDVEAIPVPVSGPVEAEPATATNVA